MASFFSTPLELACSSIVHERQDSEGQIVNRVQLSRESGNEKKDKGCDSEQVVEEKRERERERDRERER